MKTYPTITIGDLKSRLAIYPDHYTLDFSGLAFSRLHQRGETLVQMEFAQQVYRDAKGDVVVENLE